MVSCLYLCRHRLAPVGLLLDVPAFVAAAQDVAAAAVVAAVVAHEPGRSSPGRDLVAPVVAVAAEQLLAAAAAELTRARLAPAVLLVLQDAQPAQRLHFAPLAAALVVAYVAPVAQVATHVTHSRRDLFAQ